MQSKCSKERDILGPWVALPLMWQTLRGWGVCLTRKQLSFLVLVWLPSLSSWRADTGDLRLLLMDCWFPLSTRVYLVGLSSRSPQHLKSQNDSHFDKEFLIFSYTSNMSPCYLHWIISYIKRLMRLFYFQTKFLWTLKSMLTWVGQKKFSLRNQYVCEIFKIHSIFNYI